MTSQPFADKRVKSYHLIFNPISGPGEPGAKLAEIEAGLSSISNLTVRLTEADTPVEDLARQAVHEGADVVIAAGGDGTVSGVAAALVDTDVKLGIIPSGTANAFATTLKMPENFLDACDIIKAGHFRQVDTARCNDHMMLLAVSVGLEADMLDRMEREEKAKFGKLAIVINSLKELKEVEQFKAHIETLDHTWDEPATAITIANTATNTMVLAQGPADVTADDGLLSITLITPEHQWGFLKSAAHLFLSALQEQAVENKVIHSCKARSVKVTTDPPQTIFVDGEPFDESALTIECKPRSLNVLVPR